MTRTARLALVAWIAALALGRGAPASAAPTADEVVGKVQAFYAHVHQLTTVFQQEVTNTTFGQTTRSDGLVQLVRPGKMRWDYYGKPHHGTIEVRRSFLASGKDLFVVDAVNQQIVHKRIDQDLLPVIVSFLYGKGDLRRAFHAALDTSGAHGGKDDLVLALTPKRKSARYKMLYLVVDPGDFRVKESIVVDATDDVDRVRFFLPDTRTAVPDARFALDPAVRARYRMVDLDHRGSGRGSR